MSRYLAMLKDKTEKNSQNPDPLALSKLPKPLLTVLAVGRVAVYVKKIINLTEVSLFPVWCSKSCSRLEERGLPDGKVRVLI